ncbi:MAG: hypothetical protein QT08_C0013G0014 [archaeon GW2011_AR17]|nr:MAG: hypothetical protein QT08_C0013G0014 [archaeon GW2011_AR17]MBS3153857.1 nucleotidyltransferase domain-containing protein [Candidatus Woesearchaeota archaeon]HIH15458.1 nucleotidyltransferase domain-containing protein [Nanoarchaeota archaeon]HIH59261.1 nucleotidyltransferase domain-containing protein [Nanoarchaeota archaeon]HII13944.1 nucleotidyltransferase domain-containing protein [Nanoarchaeota archaeon]
MNKSYAVSYALNFLSFLFIDKEIEKKIETIYLFGSGARKELEKDSDIDIFIDCKEEREIEKRAKAAVERFYESKDYEKWKILKFTYPITIEAGELKNWEVKSSIEKEGILLYARKTPIFEKKERKILLTIKLPKEKKKYLHLTRELFGRKEKGYKEGALLQELHGEKIAANIIIIPKEESKKIIDLLNKEKIEYKFKEIFS